MTAVVVVAVVWTLGGAVVLRFVGRVIRMAEARRTAPPAEQAGRRVHRTPPPQRGAADPDPENRGPRMPVHEAARGHGEPDVPSARRASRVPHGAAPAARSARTRRFDTS